MSDSICGGNEGHPRAAVWSFDLGDGVIPWVGSAPPDVRSLRSVRRIRSRSGAGHVPTHAYSTTTGGHLRLESGLEHDLVRDLDRDPSVVWLVAQPARLRLAGSDAGGIGAVPDLLSLSDGGQVTVWAVRPTGRQDEKFAGHVEQIRDGCAQFGWTQRVFAGMNPTRRSNLMWLDGYRRTMPWYRAAREHLFHATEGAITFGDVLDVDGGEGHVVSAVWHAVRHGVLECDLDEPFTQDTELRFRYEGAA